MCDNGRKNVTQWYFHRAIWIEVTVSLLNSLDVTAENKKIRFVGAFGSPKRMHSRGKFLQNCLVQDQEERRKKLAHGGAVVIDNFGHD